MFPLFYIFISLVFKPYQCRFVLSNEPYDLQRYSKNQPYQNVANHLNHFESSDNYSPTREQRTVQDPVGIVYGNGRPIGFLQPYGNVYQITSEEVNGQPNKKEYDDNSESVSNEQQQTLSKYNSEYPAVLTNFKIDSKLKNRELPMKRQFSIQSSKSVKKREVGLTKQNVDRLKEALQNYEETPMAKEKIQEVLSEMGYAEFKHPQKRESSQEEDEDMEQGVNAIRLIKETHEDEKRKLSNKKSVKQNEAKITNSDSQKDNLDEGDEREEEEEQKTREKRNDATTQNSELMRNLEKSGDLTVSGNKSPLASSGETPKNDKKSTEKETQSETEEERVAREIQAKIDAIKDQVKRQIAEAKQKENGDRKKREVNTLLKAENAIINPQYNAEEDGVRHVRRKRSIVSTETENRDKRSLSIPLSPYHEEDVEIDDEDDEFEDDGFQDRTAALNSNPRVANDLEWENSLFYDDVSGDGFVRKKRHDPQVKQKMLEHLSAVKERSEMPRNYPKGDEEKLRKAHEKLQQIADMSDADLFGPLPEGFQGGLARYKRVKRDPLKNKEK